jgi:RHS repeat-associated protein
VLALNLDRNLPMMNYSPLTTRFSALTLTFSLSVVMPTAHAEAMPEGMKGWTYFTGINSTQQYVSDPVEACTLSAENHMRSPLLAMRSTPGGTGMLDCKYRHMLGVPKGGEWYGIVTLVCDAGYSPRSPGVCVKQAEAPAPSPDPSCCSEEDVGFSLGNPVQLASGAKVQTETDLIAGPSEWLRIQRTYRTLRKNWSAQSAGVGWSFSFDRELVVDRFSMFLPFVSGTFGDGSVFAFDLLPGGKLVSRYDKRVSMKALDVNYNDLLLTTIDGHVERYKNFNGTYKMVSSHSATGGSATFSYDAERQLTSISDDKGRSVKIGWRDGVVESIDGPDGGVRYEYQQASVAGQADIIGMARLEAIHFQNHAGAVLASRRYHYESESSRYFLTGITDENNARFATYTYNVAGQGLSSEHAGGAGRYTFSYPTNVTRRVIDPLGTERFWALTYPSDTRGRVASESRPAGAGSAAASSKFEYADRGELISTTDFNGNKTCFGTDAARGLQTRRISGLKADAACPVTTNDGAVNTARMISTQWHPDWPLKSVIAEPNRLTSYVYNGERGADGQIARCSAGTLPNGKSVAVLCSKSVQATTDNNGMLGFAAAKTGAARAWQYTYDSAGKLLTRTGPADAAGNRDALLLTYYVDTTGEHTAGDLATATNGAGELTQFRAYSKDGLATNIKLPNGQIIKLEYGPRQRLASRTVEDGRGLSQTTSYQYDDAGQLTRVTAADGTYMDYVYDAAHRLTDLRDAAGNAVHFTLDDMGNVIKQEIRDPAGVLVTTSKRTFDALNRLQKEQRDDQDPGVTYAYDRGGNLTKVTDPLGRATTQAFDSYDRVMTQVLPPPMPGAAAPVISYGYSNQDDLVSVTDPRKLITRYTVDGLGQQTTTISPDTGTTTSAFDGAGTPDFSIDAAARKTIYRFDAARRLTQLGSSTFEYGKDGSGATGRLTKMNDASGQTSYSYDGFGGLLTKVQSVGAGASAKKFTTSYTYGTTGSSIGHVTSMTYPSGNRIEYAYGTDGRVKSLVLIAPGASPVAILRDIRYLAFGAARGWTWGNSTTGSPNTYERKFDLDGKVVSYPLGHPANNGSVRTLSYDALGRIRATKHSGAGATLDQRYDYDGLDRLITFDSVSTFQRFAYDANGNRTRATFGANTYLTAVHSANNRVTSTSGPAPAKQNSYDLTGNLTNDGTTQYKYGTDGRLSSNLRTGVTSSYQYNGLGQRVTKTGTRALVVHYIYDESGRLLGEYDETGNAIQETVQLDDMPVAVFKPGPTAAGPKTVSIYYVYPDHLGTPRVITRANDNKMVWRWDSADPFGFNQPDENPSGLSPFIFNLRFPGQLFDKETNNHYNYFRDYDPQSGRYVQSDPIGLFGGVNTYTYVRGNPVSLIDPFGLADINLFSPTQPALHNAANEWNPPGVFSVAGHGNPFNMIDENKRVLFPYQLAQRIRANPNFTGQRIVLGSCNTALPHPGQNMEHFAQMLANYLGAQVTGSTDFTYPGQGELSRIPANGNGGKWKTVSPQPGYKGPKF